MRLRAAAPIGFFCLQSYGVTFLAAGNFRHQPRVGFTCTPCQGVCSPSYWELLWLHWPCQRSMLATWIRPLFSMTNHVVCRLRQGSQILVQSLRNSTLEISVDKLPKLPTGSMLRGSKHHNPKRFLQSLPKLRRAYA